MMKAMVREIVDAINNNPEVWKPVKGMFKWDGLEYGKFKLTEYGNTKLMSVINLEVNGVRIQTSFTDCYYLEKAVIKWYKTAPLEQFQS